MSRSLVLGSRNLDRVDLHPVPRHVSRPPKPEVMGFGPPKITVFGTYLGPFLVPFLDPFLVHASRDNHQNPGLRPLNGFRAFPETTPLGVPNMDPEWVSSWSHDLGFHGPEISTESIFILFDDMIRHGQIHGSRSSDLRISSNLDHF